MKAAHSVIQERSALATLCETYRQQGSSIIFTNGCFDILHHGHIDLLEKAGQFADILILGINDDESVRQLKGAERPINTLSSRMRVLSAIKYVDHIVSFSEDTPMNLIELIKPDVLVKGGDYTIATVVGAEFVMSYGGKVEIIPLTEGFSTTNIERNIKNHQT